jgi:Signal transduction histidine kinase
MTVIVILLGIALMGMIIRQGLLKREIKRIAGAIKQRASEQGNTLLSVELPEKEVVSLAIALNDLNEAYQEKTQEYHRQSAEFKQSMADISHDLRTPLTALDGYLNLMVDEENKEKQHQYLRIACEKVEILNYLVTSLFELARLESQAYPLEWQSINLTALLENELASFYPEFLKINQEPQVTISTEPLWIRSDYIALQRIFSNLLQNTISHGDGDIVIKATQKADNAIIKISNVTNNLTNAEVAKLFKRNYKPEMARSKSGAGLGLAITKAFVELMDGNITAALESKRLVITVSLPLQKIKYLEK